MVLPVISAILLIMVGGVHTAVQKYLMRTVNGTIRILAKMLQWILSAAETMSLNSAIMSLPMAQNLKYMVLTVKSYSLKILME